MTGRARLKHARSHGDVCAGIVVAELPRQTSARTPSLVAGNVRFRAVAKPISTSDKRRKADGAKLVLTRVPNPPSST